MRAGDTTSRPAMGADRAATAAPRPVTVVAPDGFRLGAFEWRHPDAGERPVVLINAATAVRCDYYGRFAAFLAGHGFDVLTYDYRGIGASRPASLRRLEAGWLEWGALDCEAMLRHAAHAFPRQPIQVVAHSAGGFVMGLAPSNRHITRAFTVGAQFAYWRDYAPDRRLALLIKWHVIMPALTRLFGYFPGKRLGWLEDTPRGVVRDWTARHPRFEDAYRRGSRALDARERARLVERFAQVPAALLALSVSDDEFGTIAATRRLLGYFSSSAATHLHVTPQEVGVAQIGHLAFFHSRFAESLWRIPLEWLRHGRVPPDAPGQWLAIGGQPASSASIR